MHAHILTHSHMLLSNSVGVHVCVHALAPKLESHSNTMTVPQWFTTSSALMISQLQKKTGVPLERLISLIDCRYHPTKIWCLCLIELVISHWASYLEPQPFGIAF